MKIAYEQKRFSEQSLEIINTANMIIDAYMKDGLKLTLRQLYYQFIAKDLFPDKWRDKKTGSKNTEASYGKLGNVISNARLAGLVDWKAIEDRGRVVKSKAHWDDPGQIIRSAAWGFRIDHWEGQEFRPEVWIEKEALLGVIEEICNSLDVSFFACKGYVSQSAMWEASRRFQRRHRDDKQQPVIIHLGDHDPSGIDMTRDINDRQYLFGGQIQLERIALNMDQVEAHNPPPNPTKVTDSRASHYIKMFGHECWELDALDPKMLRELIRQKVLNYRDETLYQQTLEKEREYRKVLDDLAENWEDYVS